MRMVRWKVSSRLGENYTDSYDIENLADGIEPVAVATERRLLMHKMTKELAEAGDTFPHVSLELLNVHA